MRTADAFFVASHSVTHAARLRFLARATPEPALADAPAFSDQRPQVLHQLAWDSLSYWKRRRLHWKALLIGLSASGAGLAAWLYLMSKLV